MTTLAVGVDVVGVPGFAEQLADQASGFVAATFTEAERRAVPGVSPRRELGLAARYAAKEATIKAWSGARAGRPPAVASVDLREIEVVSDPWGRPAIALHGRVAEALAALPEELGLAGRPALHVSLSHDWPVATAMVVLALTDTVV